MRDWGYWSCFVLGSFAGVLLGLALTVTQDAQAGKRLGETSTYSRQQGFETRIAYVASGSDGAGQIEYVGTAVFNSATSAASWRIMRLSYNSDDQLTTVEWAGGDDAYNGVWDDRVTLNY